MLIPVYFVTTGSFPMAIKSWNSFTFKATPPSSSPTPPIWTVDQTFQNFGRTISMTVLTYQGLNTKNVYLLDTVLTTYTQNTGPHSYSIAKQEGASCPRCNHTPQWVRALFLFCVIHPPAMVYQAKWKQSIIPGWVTPNYIFPLFSQYNWYQLV